MNLKQLKEILSLCRKNKVKEIIFGKIHVQFKEEPVQVIQEPDHVVIQALGGAIPQGGNYDAFNKREK